MLLFQLWAVPSTFGQQDNRRCLLLPLPYQGAIDSLLIDPASVYFLAPNAPDTLSPARFEWKYDWSNQTLSLKNKKTPITLDSIRLCYRVWPARISEPLQKRIRPVDDTVQYLERLVQQDFSPIEEASFISLQGLGGEPLQSSGQLSRGVSLERELRKM